MAGITSDAGGFAAQRFKQRRSAWRRRIWWAIPLASAFPVLVGVVLGLLFAGEHLPVFLGFAAGVGVAMATILTDSPPQHIERWRQGAEGERATAKAVRRLVRAGWTLINDVDTGRGNIDHILIGPPGVFMLESKNLHGDLSVRGGVLTVRWHEDPVDGYDDARIGRSARACAAKARGLLADYGLAAWVQPVVVLWGSFEQRSVLSDGVAWVSGRHLADVLDARPTVLTASEVDRAALVARSLPSLLAAAAGT